MRSHPRDECVTRSSRSPARRYHTGALALRTQGWLTTVREQNSTPAGTWATRAGTPAGTQPPTMDGVRRGRPGRADRRRDRRQRRPRTGHHRRARVAGRAGDHGLPGRGEGRGRPRVASRRRAGAHRGPPARPGRPRRRPGVRGRRRRAGGRARQQRGADEHPARADGPGTRDAVRRERPGPSRAPAGSRAPAHRPRRLAGLARTPRRPGRAGRPEHGAARIPAAGRVRALQTGVHHARVRVAAAVRPRGLRIAVGGSAPRLRGDGAHPTGSEGSAATRPPPRRPGGHATARSGRPCGTAAARWRSTATPRVVRADRRRRARRAVAPDAPAGPGATASAAGRTRSVPAS